MYLNGEESQTRVGIKSLYRKHIIIHCFGLREQEGNSHERVKR